MTTTSTTLAPTRAHEDLVHAVAWARHHGQPLFIAGVVLVVVVFLVKWRVERWLRYRRDDEASWAAPIKRLIRGDVTVKKVTRKGGQIVYMRLRYAPDAILYGPGFAGLEANLSEQLGLRLTVDLVKPKRQIHLRLEASEKASEKVDERGLLPRAQNLARQLLGPEARVVNSAFRLDGTFERFAIEHESIKDADIAEQVKIDNAVHKKLGQKFQPKWEPHNDRVTYRASPDLPAFVPHPIGVKTAKPTQIPFATDAHGNVICWDLKISPHALVCGPTNGGKSTTLMALVTEMCARGVEVRVCDVKKTSLLGLMGWPGVTEHATEPDDIAACILGVEAEMQRRYRAVRDAFAEGLDRPTMRPLLILIDETWETIEVLNEAVKGRDDAEAVRAFKSITRLGRQCDVHIIAAFQQPDAKILSGESRQNFGCRVLLGDRKRALPMLELSRVVSSPVVGRAMVNAGNSEHEVQIWFTPDQAEYRKLLPPQKEILDGLRAAAERAQNPAPTTVPEATETTSRPVLTLLREAPKVEPEPAKPAVKVCLNVSNPDRICASVAQGIDPEFGTDMSRTDGLNPRCKACERERFAGIRAAQAVKRKQTPRS